MDFVRLRPARLVIVLFFWPHYFTTFGIHSSLLFGLPARPVTAYFDLSSYLYLSRLIHDTSLIIPELSVPPDRLYCLYICTCARVNAYWTYPLSRYSATILLNVHTRVSATYLPIPYGCSHAHSPFLVDSFRVIPFAISLTREAIPYCGLRSLLYMIVYLTAH